MIERKNVKNLVQKYEFRNGQFFPFLMPFFHMALFPIFICKFQHCFINYRHKFLLFFYWPNIHAWLNPGNKADSLFLLESNTSYELQLLYMHLLSMYSQPYQLRNNSLLFHHTHFWQLQLRLLRSWNNKNFRQYTHILKISHANDENFMNKSSSFIKFVQKSDDFLW